MIIQRQTHKLIGKTCYVRIGLQAAASWPSLLCEYSVNGFQDCMLSIFSWQWFSDLVYCRSSLEWQGPPMHTLGLPPSPLLCLPLCVCVCLHVYMCMCVWPYTYLHVLIHVWVQLAMHVFSDLLKLVYMEDAPGVPAMWPHFLAKAWGVPMQCSTLEAPLDPSTHPWRSDNIITKLTNSACSYMCVEGR